MLLNKLYINNSKVINTKIVFENTEIIFVIRRTINLIKNLKN